MEVVSPAALTKSVTLPYPPQADDGDESQEHLHLLPMVEVASQDLPPPEDAQAMRELKHKSRDSCKTTTRVSNARPHPLMI